VSPLLTRVARKVVPSTARLTYNPLFGRALDIADRPVRLLYREFAKLPPNRMRVRVGVGNRLVFNHVEYLVSAKNLWLVAFARGLCRLDSTIVELGCGCGRSASHLRDLEFGGERFAGRYYGVDIDAEMVAWCRANFDDRFTFLEATGRSRTYSGSEGEPYRVPLDDGTVDFVFSLSLFTHLLEAELLNYVRESSRLLRPGGATLQSFFSVENPPPTFGGRHTFAHRIGKAHVESLRQPEAAVAYSERFMRDAFTKAGFSPEVSFLLAGGQAFLLARKPV
jgi:SAM-dependent methyltransferase